MNKGAQVMFFRPEGSTSGVCFPLCRFHSHAVDLSETQRWGKVSEKLRSMTYQCGSRGKNRSFPQGSDDHSMKLSY